MSKKNKIILLACAALLTLAVPFYLILTSQALLDSGPEHVYKFKLQPVDPYDMMRGRYITLRFEGSNSVAVNSDIHKNFRRGQEVYVNVTRDSAGFAHFNQAFEKAPAGTHAYFLTTVNWSNSYDAIQPTTLDVDIPFNRYYLNEDKAPQAESIFSRRLMEENSMYALVVIKDGRQVLKGVYVGDESLNDYLTKHRHE